MAHLYAIQYREMNKALSIEKNFLEALRQEKNSQNIFFKHIDIYHHLFSMLQYYSKNFLREVVDQYQDNPHDWFYSFHKQFRQVDMFEGLGFFDRKISEEDNQKRSDLIKERRRYVDANTPSHKDYEDEEEWLKAEKDFWDNDEKLKEFKRGITPFNREYHVFEMKEPFCGHMDMVMWETIANDSDNTLYRFMDDFMAMHYGVISYTDKEAE